MIKFIMDNILFLILGYFLRPMIDSVFKGFQRKADFKINIQTIFIKDFLISFPELIHKCKIQIQDYQYIFHEEYWIAHGQTKVSLKNIGNEVTDRSSQLLN